MQLSAAGVPPLALKIAATALPRKYTQAAIDVASANGHVETFNWWFKQPFLIPSFSPAAIELASPNGHIPCLEFWEARVADGSMLSGGAFRASGPTYLAIYFATAKTRNQSQSRSFSYARLAREACRNGHVPIFDWILKRVDDHTSWATASDVVPLMACVPVAVLCGQVEVVKWLQDKMGDSLSLPQTAFADAMARASAPRNNATFLDALVHLGHFSLAAWYLDHWLPRTIGTAVCFNHITDKLLRAAIAAQAFNLLDVGSNQAVRIIKGQQPALFMSQPPAPIPFSSAGVIALVDVESSSVCAIASAGNLPAVREWWWVKEFGDIGLSSD
ncbi:hypothetical protein BCR44DRAFT_53453 [Catenaria anguillulae PL171]|uniref:Uncharacterized protein n=1 Tax=Catenaria anguillulae PL171 TaxID=765915 RepID=A0A1Y2H8D4_9FUNG|nr:hypothetical protein BCR44DRAFT_53453 [Catenaria anguillulae PL171]